MKILRLCAICICIVLSGCKGKIQSQPIRYVKVLEIVANDESAYRKVYSGTVTPVSEANLAFKIAGPIININVNEGSHVKKGDILASLDTRDYQVNLDAYESKYSAAKSQAQNARAQFDRISYMYKEKAISKKTYDEVKSLRDMAVAQEKIAYEEYINAQHKMSDTNIVAPYDGIITGKLADTGTVVNAGLPVLSIMNDSAMQVTISISSDDVNLFEKDNINATFETKDNKYPLKIKEISRKAGIAHATYPVILEFADETNLIPGSTGQVIIYAETQNNISSPMTIPLSAIFYDDKDSSECVWIYRDGVIEKRRVLLDRLTNNGAVKVKSGLSVGDKIIESGIHNLYEGEIVKELEPFADTNIGKQM